MKENNFGPPRWLSRIGKWYWSQLAPQIAEWTPQKKQQLVLLCDWYATYREACDQLDRDGLTLTSDNGQVKQHPSISTKYQASTQILRILKTIGLSEAKLDLEGEDLDNFFEDDSN